MFIGGNHDAAKAVVHAILEQSGWETEDLEAVEAACVIDRLCLLWRTPGFLNNQFSS